MELNKLKQYLGIQGNEKDKILQFIMLDVTEMIKNYCNISEVPEGLLNTSYRMAVDLYRNENIGNEEDARLVSSIKEGDVSVSFSEAAASDFQETVLKNYEPSLKRYRKVGFR